MNNQNAFLRVEDLRVEYVSGGKTVHAVNGVSFDLERGKTLGLVGETGAGKTTTALSILQLLPKFTARIPTGETITPEALAATETAERYLFSLGLTNFRIRMYRGAARIQVLQAQLPLLLSHREDILAHLKPLYKAVLLDLEVRS